MDEIYEILKKILPLILSSVVIAELIKMIVDVSKNKFNKKIEYKINRVKCTEPKLKDIIVNIKKCKYLELNSEKTELYLCQLQSYLDVEGYMRKYDYNVEGYVWKDIERLRNSTSEKIFEANKELLITDLILIQQFHENSIKKEFQGRKVSVAIIIISLFITVLHTCYYVIFGMKDSFLYFFELFIILSTTIGFPAVVYDSLFEMEHYEKHARKRNCLRKVVKGKKKEVAGQVINSLIIVFLGISLVYLLQVGNALGEERILIASETTSVDIENSMDVTNFQKDEVKEDLYEEEEVIKKIPARNLWEIIYCSLEMEEFKFYLYISFVYLLCGIICVFSIWTQKEEKFLFEKTVRKLRIEKNSIYIEEIKDLINKVKSMLSQKEKNGYTLICDKMLVLAYVRLDDMREYIITEKNKHMSAMELYDDVEKELRFFSIEDKIEQVLNLLKEIGKIKIVVEGEKKSKIKKWIDNLIRKDVVKEKEKIKKIKEMLGEIIEKLNLIDDVVS